MSSFDLEHHPRPASQIIVLGETTSLRPFEPSTPSITVTESSLKSRVRFLTPRRSRTYGDLRQASNGDHKKLPTFENLMSKVAFTSEAHIKQAPIRPSSPSTSQQGDLARVEEMATNVSDWMARKHGLKTEDVMPEVTAFLLSKEQSSPGKTKPRSETYPPSTGSIERRRFGILDRRRIKLDTKNNEPLKDEESSRGKDQGTLALTDVGKKVGRKDNAVSGATTKPSTVPKALHIVPRLSIDANDKSKSSPSSPTARFAHFLRAKSEAKADEKRRQSVLEEGLRLFSSTTGRPSSALAGPPSDGGSVLTIIHDPKRSSRTLSERSSLPALGHKAREENSGNISDGGRKTKA